MSEYVEKPVEDYASYARAARRRAAAEQQKVQDRYQRAWTLARRAADLLRQRYAVRRVALFGSLLHQEHFTARSDVDVAVWGISWPAYLHALAEVSELDADIEIDLVDVTCCHALLREAIESEGVEL